MNEMADLQEQIEALDAWELIAILTPPPTLCCCCRPMPMSTLSGGERRRVALCRAAGTAGYPLLDEPTNHLMPGGMVEQALREYPGTVITVTHDRYFLDRSPSGLSWKRPRLALREIIQLGCSKRRSDYGYRRNMKACGKNSDSRID